MWTMVFRHVSTKFLVQCTRVEHGKCYTVNSYCVTFRWKARPGINYVKCDVCNPLAGTMKRKKFKCLKPETCFKFVDTGLFQGECHEITSGQTISWGAKVLTLSVLIDIMAQGGMDIETDHNTTYQMSSLPCKRTQGVMAWYEDQLDANQMTTGVPALPKPTKRKVGKASPIRRSPASPQLQKKSTPELPAFALAMATTQGRLQKEKGNPSTHPRLSAGGRG